MKYLKKVLKLFKSDLALPLFLIIFYVGFVFLIRGVVPSSDELIESFQQIYAKYGYEIILTAAFLESLVLVNFFVPGVVAMALGAIFASTGQIDLKIVILTASIGAIFGYILNYNLGLYGVSDFLKRFGYSKFLKIAETHLKNLGVKGLFIGFIYPATGAIISVVSGTIKFNFFKFIITCIMAVFFWMSFWGIMFYLIGQALLALITKHSYLILIFVVLIFYLINLKRNKTE